MTILSNITTYILHRWRFECQVCYVASGALYKCKRTVNRTDAANCTVIYLGHIYEKLIIKVLPVIYCALYELVPIGKVTYLYGQHEILLTRFFC